jgi:uncharacterized membrane protein
MTFSTKRSGLPVALLLGFMSLGSYAGTEADSVILYTPYPKITVVPGQGVDYSIDVINIGGEVITADLSLSGVPKGWTYTLKGGNYEVRQISVLPNEKKFCNVHLDVPLKINKGSYRINFIVGRYAILPLTIVVSEQGTYKTEFTADQVNMQGSTTSTFTYRALLKNGTADKQLYALAADIPGGWNVSFTVDYKKVTAIEISANSMSSITIEIDPPDMIEARTYRIPVHATTNNGSSDLFLEAAIIGTYAMELTTPTGLLSTSITAGNEKRIEMVIRNTGTAVLRNIKFSAGTPVDWQVTFDPKSVDKLEPGNTAQLFATIKASKKAIAGDYLTNIDAKSSDTSTQTSLRVSVKTPLIWGWVGIMIILAAIGAVYYLFRKYGRR